MIEKLIFLQHSGGGIAPQATFDTSSTSTSGLVIVILAIVLLVILWIYLSKRKKY